jgi:hypothetical protein
LRARIGSGVRAQCLSRVSATYFRVRKPIGRLGGFGGDPDPWGNPVENPSFREVLLSNGKVLGAAGTDDCIFMLTSLARIEV